MTWVGGHRQWSDKNYFAHEQWPQYSSNNELLSQLPQLWGFAPHTHSVLWSPKHPKVLVDRFWVFRYPVRARFLCSVTFINFQSDRPQIKQWVTFRWSWDLLSPLLTSFLDIELGRAHSDCVWFVFMEMPYQVFCLFYLAAFFVFMARRCRSCLHTPDLNFLSDIYLECSLSVCILDPRSLWRYRRKMVKLQGGCIWNARMHLFEIVLFKYPPCRSVSVSLVSLCFIFLSPPCLVYVCICTCICACIHMCMGCTLLCKHMWRPCLLQLFLLCFEMKSLTELEACYSG